ncbi:hypothetical protein [Paenibacillus aquistagni]|nr:hypothetical protein [Paenibacillus aquistagni]
MRKILVGIIMMSVLFTGCSSAATNEVKKRAAGILPHTARIHAIA